MATIKYRKREFTPNENQPGMNHSWFAESVIVNELDTIEIARLIEARTGVRRYEAQSVLASFVELINEECSQSMRIKLTDEKGQKFVSIYPKVSGSISDKEVQENPQKYEGRQVARESDLTADMLTVSLAATVGVNASKQFAKNSRFEKATPLTNSVADEDEEEGTNNGQQTGGDNGQQTTDNGQQTGGDNGQQSTDNGQQTGGDDNQGQQTGGDDNGGGGGNDGPIED